MDHGRALFCNETTCQKPCRQQNSEQLTMKTFMLMRNEILPSCSTQGCVVTAIDIIYPFRFLSNIAEMYIHQKPFSSGWRMIPFTQVRPQEKQYEINISRVDKIKLCYWFGVGLMNPFRDKYHILLVHGMFMMAALGLQFVYRDRVYLWIDK